MDNNFHVYLETLDELIQLHEGWVKAGVPNVEETLSTLRSMQDYFKDNAGWIWPERVDKWRWTR